MEFRRSASERGPALTWVDRNLPRCPLCKSSSPLWEAGTEVDAAGLKRWHFRCGRCRGIVSIPSEAVVSGVGPRTVVGNALFSYVRVDSVGRSNMGEGVVGIEYHLTELQDWAACTSNQEEERRR